MIDSGFGMTREVLERAFEPFFTTKDIGKGSGLGLAQVYGVVKQFGGTVQLASEPGAGTTVEVFLPRAVSTEADTSAPKPQTPDIPIGSGTVLIVDDEPDVRDVAAILPTRGGIRGARGRQWARSARDPRQRAVVSGAGGLRHADDVRR